MRIASDGVCSKESGIASSRTRIWLEVCAGAGLTRQIYPRICADCARIFADESSAWRVARPAQQHEGMAITGMNWMNWMM
jgi:hypothetical protein